MSKEQPITLLGKKKVDAELEKLIKFEREEIKIAIAEARALGDLKENAEYHAAREKQGMIEGRIMQLQGIIASCKVIDVAAINNDKIVFGATVSLTDQDTDKEVVYQIVGQDEADTRDGKISYDSPLGRALLGKEVGDEVVVKAPKGDINYIVEKIEYK